jgi:hypothetical protein
MYVYSTVAAVYTVAKSKNNRLIIDIPIVTGDRHFDLYQVHSLLFFHKDVGKFIMID